MLYVCPVNILYKSIAGHYRPVRVADGPITARYRFIKNASWVITCKKCKAQHVGQTSQNCANRMNNHKFDIVHFPDMFTMFQNISILLGIPFKIFHLCLLRKFQITGKDFSRKHLG